MSTIGLSVRARHIKRVYQVVLREKGEKIFICRQVQCQDVRNLEVSLDKLFTSTTSRNKVNPEAQVLGNPLNQNHFFLIGLLLQFS